MNVHPQDREAADPLRAQWDRVGDLRVQLARQQRIYLSEPQRLGVGLLTVAYFPDKAKDRLESLEQAEKMLAKGRPVEETEALLEELGEQIAILKELERSEVALDAPAVA
jgi:hypothetical protein